MNYNFMPPLLFKAQIANQTQNGIQNKKPFEGSIF